MEKIIIFDICGVIVKGTAVSVLEQFNIPEEDYNEIIRFFRYDDKLDMGEMTLQDVFVDCNFPLEISSKYKDILLNFYKYREYNTDIIEVIEKLKKHNYKVYILTDNSKETAEYYLKNPRLSIVDGYIVSADYNATKKDGRLFDIMLDKYNLKPEQCYFIDDRRKNIEQAIKHNINVYQYDENESVENLYNYLNSKGFII